MKARGVLPSWAVSHPFVCHSLLTPSWLGDPPGGSPEGSLSLAPVVPSRGHSQPAETALLWRGSIRYLLLTLPDS